MKNTKMISFIVLLALVVGVVGIVDAATPTTNKGLNWKELLVDITDIETQLATSEVIHAAAVSALETYILQLEAEIAEHICPVSDTSALEAENAILRQWNNMVYFYAEAGGSVNTWIYDTFYPYSIVINYGNPFELDGSFPDNFTLWNSTAD